MKRLPVLFALFASIGLAQYIPPSGGGGSASSIGPGAQAYNASTQSISGNTPTALTFNTNSWDTCSSCTIHSTSSNPTRFTAPSTGYYLAICSVLALAANVNLNLFFEVNSAMPAPTAGSNGTATGNTNTFGVYAQIYKLNSGDFIECFTDSNAGYTTTANQSMMSLTKLSATF